MKILTSLTVFIGLFVLARFVYAARSVPGQKDMPGIYTQKIYPSSVYCQSAEGGDGRALPDCLSALDGTLEKTFDEVENLKSDVVFDKFLADSTDKTTDARFDNLQDRVKELEGTVDAQITLLDLQRQRIEELQKLFDAQLQTDQDLQEQIDKLRAAKKPPQAAAKAKEGKAP